MKLIVKQNYDKNVRINHRDVKCYSRKMLKELHPNGNYILVGETFENNKKEEIDTISIAKKDLKVSKYGDNSKIIYARKGYIAIEKNKYLVILQNRIPFILLLFGIMLLGITIGIWGYKTYKNVPVIAPEYPLPPEDEKSTDIKNDNSVRTETEHKNHASIKVSREVTINLNDKEVTLSYKNFNASNKDAVVTLCILRDNNEYAIARSGLVKAGKEIQTIDLLDDTIKLTQGVYKGRIKIDFYDEITGEKAATSTDFDDVEVTVK